MKAIYGTHMKESRGKKHNYLIMDLDFSLDVEVRVTMKYYLNNSKSGFTETIKGSVVTPSA